MQLYPNLKEITLTKIAESLKFIIRARYQDVQEINSLPQVYLTARKVGKVPSASNDVLATDKINDMNWDSSYFYVLIDNAGTPVWRRATLASW